MFDAFINKITLNPKKLFLIDGFGALLSAFLLGVILTRFQSTFGMPHNTLYFLSFLPCVFLVYDFICYVRIKENWVPYAKAIAFANVIYCFISIGLVFMHFQKLTHIGLIYFLLEIVIIVGIVCVELKIAYQLASDRIRSSS